MMANGSIIRLLGKEFFIILRVTSILVTGLSINQMDLVGTPPQKVPVLKVTGKMIFSMAKVLSYSQVVTNMKGITIQV